MGVVLRSVEAAPFFDVLTASRVAVGVVRTMVVNHVRAAGVLKVDNVGLLDEGRGFWLRHGLLFRLLLLLLLGLFGLRFRPGISGLVVDDRWDALRLAWGHFPAVLGLFFSQSVVQRCQMRVVPLSAAFCLHCSPLLCLGDEAVVVLVD